MIKNNKLSLMALLALSIGSEALGSSNNNSWIKYAGVLAIGVPLTSFLIYKSVTSSTAEKKARADDASLIEARKKIWDCLEREQEIPAPVIDVISDIQKEFGEEHMTAHHMKMKMASYNAKIKKNEKPEAQVLEVRKCFNNLVGQNLDGSYFGLRFQQQRKTTLAWSVLTGLSGLATAGTCALAYSYSPKK